MKASLVLLVLTLLMSGHVVAEGQPCAAIAATVTSSIMFLEEQRVTRQSPCISAVIKQVGQSRDVSAAHVLVRYLDFVDPATAPSPDGSAFTRPDYPAVDALFQIGKPATRELVSAIQAGESSKIRENAANTYMFVYRDDLASGIRLLKKEELLVQSADARSRLRDAVQMLVDACNGRGGKEAEQCKNTAEKK